MHRQSKIMVTVLLGILALLTALPAVAQVPRAVFVEMGSATW